MPTPDIDRRLFGRAALLSVTAAALPRCLQPPASTATPELTRFPNQLRIPRSKNPFANDELPPDYYDQLQVSAAQLDVASRIAARIKATMSPEAAVSSLLNMALVEPQFSAADTDRSLTLRDEYSQKLLINQSLVLDQNENTPQLTGLLIPPPPLDSSYNDNLVLASPELAEFFPKLHQAAQDLDLLIILSRGYATHKQQQALFESNLFPGSVAYSGTSEHHSGLAFDIYIYNPAIGQNEPPTKEQIDQLLAHPLLASQLIQTNPNDLPHLLALPHEQAEIINAAINAHNQAYPDQPIKFNYLTSHDLVCIQAVIYKLLNVVLTK